VRARPARRERDRGRRADLRYRRFSRTVMSCGGATRGSVEVTDDGGLQHPGGRLQ
jgi:hypothetical protein